MKRLQRAIAIGTPVLTLSLTLALALAPCALAAQSQGPPPEELPDKSLEDLLAMPVESVEGAARHSQRTTEAPASVSVITANDIETFGWRTLADVLKSVRGFHVTYDRNYSYVGVRAFGRPTDYNNRVLVLVDGQRVNDSIYDGALLGTEGPVDLSVVDRIEVIRGPGSALYGTSAFLAVVNVITKRGAQVGARQVGIEGASFDTYRVHASQGWSDDRGRDVMVSATKYDSRGPASLFFPEFADTNGGLAVNLDGDKTTKLFASATLGRWRFQSVFSEREKRVPTASWGTTFGDSGFFTGDTRAWANGSYTREVKGATVHGRAYVDHYQYYGDYPFDTLETDGSQADAVGGEVSVRQRIGRHSLTVGVEQRTNIRQNQWYAGAGVTIDDQRHSNEVAAYLQDEVALTPRLTAIIGGRFDWWSLKGGTGRPRLGLVYRTEKDTAIKALYGEAYRAPNLYELYYYVDPDAQVAPADRIDPESVRTFELVVERHLGHRLRVSASGYHTRITGLIDPELLDTGAIIYANNESARSTGIELEGETRWPSGLLVRSSLAVQRAGSASVDRLSNAPGQLGTLQAALPFWRRQLVLATDTTYTSWRNTVGGERLPAYWLSNITATYKPIKWPIIVGATVYNAFDASYSHPVGVEFTQIAVPQDGRTAALRFSVKF
jgi:outer membrane cobalamin receptor